jgi:hypothetical protein
MDIALSLPPKASNNANIYGLVLPETSGNFLVDIGSLVLASVYRSIEWLRKHLARQTDTN